MSNRKRHPLRALAPTLATWLAVSACAARAPVKPDVASPAACAEHATPSSSPAPAPSQNAADREATTQRLTKTLLDSIARPTPGQFDTPERVLGFLFEKVASRDLAGALAAFPVVEEAERVTRKDLVEYLGATAAETHPPDSDARGRLNYALARRLQDYRELSVRVLSDNSGGVVSIPPGTDPTDALREFDGSRLKALKVTSLKEVKPASPPVISAVDRAIGVTEKRFYEATIELEQRTIRVSGFVGLVAGDWRVLSVNAYR